MEINNIPRALEVPCRPSLTRNRENPPASLNDGQQQSIPKCKAVQRNGTDRTQSAGQHLPRRARQCQYIFSKRYPGARSPVPPFQVRSCKLPPHFCRIFVFSYSHYGRFQILALCGTSVLPLAEPFGTKLGAGTRPLPHTATARIPEQQPLNLDASGTVAGSARRPGWERAHALLLLPPPQMRVPYAPGTPELDTSDACEGSSGSQSAKRGLPLPPIPASHTQRDRRNPQTETRKRRVGGSSSSQSGAAYTPASTRLRADTRSIPLPYLPLLTGSACETHAEMSQTWARCAARVGK
ncbi:hypothetical protein BD779DRAFT_1024846 [Infundibulicybe gibba]|nr:hypothetical protein BD779DRAFT_1024846 [Infundibulicybe gibba]